MNTILAKSGKPTGAVFVLEWLKRLNAANSLVCSIRAMLAKSAEFTHLTSLRLAADKDEDDDVALDLREITSCLLVNEAPKDQIAVPLSLQAHSE
jgi:hypothetical protein